MQTSKTNQNGDSTDEVKETLIEFIQSMDKMKLEAIEAERRRVVEEFEESESKESTPKIGGCAAFRFLNRKNRDSASPSESESPNNERKISAESSRIKPSLRMKAFKNNRQSASASEMNSTSAASLTEDFLRMPFVEGMTSQVSQSKQKVYNKVHSEPLLPNGSGKRNEEPKKRQLRLHMVELPNNGGTVGYCTEEHEEAAAKEIEEQLRATAIRESSAEPSSSGLAVEKAIDKK
ncbi:hypothetical protein M3Y96_00663600 [Aphelenchoides besseyi]|nr:hypothetical protein M3Y96_00663600 [Aphelenchoides besseyi]